jgi:hypothetical protein
MLLLGRVPPLITEVIECSSSSSSSSSTDCNVIIVVIVYVMWIDMSYISVF